MSELTDDQLDAIVKAHRRSYGRSDACVCGEVYPCSVVSLVIEVKQLRAEVVRLTDGIRKHEWGWVTASYEEQREKNRRLWSLLDVAGNDSLGDRLATKHGIGEKPDAQEHIDFITGKPVAGNDPLEPGTDAWRQEREGKWAVVDDREGGT